VLAIGQADYAELRPELRDSLSWYYRVSDLHDFGELTAAMEFFTGKFGQIDALDSLNEYWLETEARLRSMFGVPGVQEEEVLYIRRKSKMKEVFSAAGIPFAAGEVVDDYASASAFAAKHGFPLVIKPDNGMGAAFTYKICDNIDLAHFFEARPDRQFIIESYVQGDIVTFDGLTDRRGNIVFWTSHVYGKGVMETVTGDEHISYYSLRAIPEDLESLGRRTVAAFKLKGRFFHLEFFRRPDSSLCIMEVNMRPPGGPTVDMFNYACDWDLYDAWARVVADKPVGHFERKYHCAFIGRKRRNDYVHSHDEVLDWLGGKLAQYTEFPPVIARAMGESAYIVRAESEDEIKQAVEYIQQM